MQVSAIADSASVIAAQITAAQAIQDEIMADLLAAQQNAPTQTESPQVK